MGKVDCCEGHHGLAREVTNGMRYFRLTESEAEELRDRARRETAGVLSTLIRRALGLPDAVMGRAPKCRCGGACERSAPCRR